MSDLLAARLADLHRQFLAAAKKFPHLRFLAVHPHDPQIDWPSFPADPDGYTLGLSPGAWRELFRQLEPRSNYALKPLDDVCWLSIDDGLWQGAFYYGGPDVDATDLLALNEHYTAAMQEFLRLADLAANHFDMPQDPDFWRDGGEMLRAERSHRWLEKLFSLSLVESCDGCLMQVQRLKADVFTASARAIEKLADGARKSKMVADATTPSAEPSRARSGKTRSSTGEKIIAALTTHHRYENDSCLNTESIGVNKLAGLAEVGSGSVSRFFKGQFPEGSGEPHERYKRLCRNKNQLIAWLRTLNREGFGSLLLGDNVKHVADER